MKDIYDDLILELARYEAEYDMKFNKRQRHLMISFAEWELQRNLQQHSVVGCKELLVRMLNTDKMKAEDERLSFADKMQFLSNSKDIEAVLKMIDDRQALYPLTYRRLAMVWN